MITITHISMFILQGVAREVRAPRPARRRGERRVRAAREGRHEHGPSRL